MHEAVLVEAGDMVEPIGVEVAVQHAVEHVEQVLVERRGDAGGVVVGRHQTCAVLDQIGAQQQ